MIHLSCGRVLFAAFVLLCLFSIAAVYMVNKVEYNSVMPLPYFIDKSCGIGTSNYRVSKGRQVLKAIKEKQACLAKT